MNVKVTATSDCRRTPNSEYRFFLYDPEDMGLMFYKSAEIRDQVAAHNISLYCDGDGWSEEVVHVCVGEVSARATKCDVEPRPKREDFASDDEHDDAMCEWGGDSDYDETCNFKLLPLTAK
jgi:hypothetical protein